MLGVYKLPTDIAVEINAVAFRDLSRKRRIVPAGYPQNLSWSPGMMAGNRLYLSGFLGADVATGKIPHDPDAQVQLAFDNMKQTLAAAGMDFRHVVFVNPYLTDKASQPDERHLREAFRIRQHAGARHDSSDEPAGREHDRVHRRGRRRSVQAARRQAEEHEPEPDGQPLRVCRRHVLLFGQGAVHAGAGNLQGIWVGTVEAQVRQTMRNLLDGLEEAGLELSNVVATNVYLDDMNDFRAHEPDLRAVLSRVPAGPHDRGAARAGGPHAPERGHVSRARTDFIDCREVGETMTDNLHENVVGSSTTA